MANSHIFPMTPYSFTSWMARSLISMKVRWNDKEQYRKQYEEAKRAEQVYRSLLQTSADAVVIYDLEGRTEYVNDSFARIFGWTLEELKGKRIPFVPESEQERTMAGIKAIIEEGRAIQDFETKRYTKHGRIIEVSISGSRYEDHEGRTAGMLVTFRDISERKRLEAQLLQAQKMEAVGTLAGGIAHDFNNLLMGIQGRSSLIMMDTPPSHPHYEHLKGIEAYVSEAADLTKQLLGFARAGKYEVKPTDLNDLIQRCTDMFERTKEEITVHRDYNESLWTVDADQSQIEQVLLNLFINAWQAMPAGGDLHIQTANVLLDESYAKVFRLAPGRYVKISVADTGLGMDEATRQRIFEPFFTTKGMGRGTGLGLASAYGIVRNHGGVIHVHSEKGEGTVFDIYLPVSDKEAGNGRATL